MDDIEKALRVLLFDRQIRGWLASHDPKALEQGMQALPRKRDYEKALRYGIITKIEHGQQRVELDDGTVEYLSPYFGAVKGGKVGARVVLHWWRPISSMAGWRGEFER